MDDMEDNENEEQAPGRITYQYLRNIVKGIAVRAGAPKFHAHSARHYCATAHKDRGGA